MSVDIVSRRAGCSPLDPSIRRSAVAPDGRPCHDTPGTMNTPRWSWAGLVLIWATGVLFWTLAAARGLGEPPLHALPFGIVQMGVAAVMAVGVWHLTGAVPWQARRGPFAAAHVPGIAVFAVGYAAAQGLAFPGDRSLLAG